MKITLFYENKNNPTTLDVPDEEFDVMVETDYRQRLAVAADKSAVVKRTVQEILDEEISKPTFNNQQTETRRHVSLSALTALEEDGKLTANNQFDEEIYDLHRAIENLSPKQKDLIFKIFWEGMKAADVAREEGVDKSAIAKRLLRIYEHIKKNLKI